jgi:hypothetical protein
MPDFQFSRFPVYQRIALMRPSFALGNLARLLVALSAVSFLVVHHRADAGETFKLEEGFTRLDNGEDLKGWKGDTEGWSVVDGAIHLDSAKAKGNIYSEQAHSRDCLIRLQFRATRGADSGVYFHGNQLQVRDYPNAGPKEYAEAAKPASEWNELELDITAGVAVIKLNGQVIEKAWSIGGDTKQGVGLQKESGDFDFRYVRFKEKA